MILHTSLQELRQNINAEAEHTKDGRVMGCLSRIFWRKLTALWRHHTVYVPLSASIFHTALVCNCPIHSPAKFALVAKRSCTFATKLKTKSCQDVNFFIGCTGDCCYVRIITTPVFRRSCKCFALNNTFSRGCYVVVKATRARTN